MGSCSSSSASCRTEHKSPIPKAKPSDDDEYEDVYLCLYDLKRNNSSCGVVSSLVRRPTWHSAIRVFRKEYSFNGTKGIEVGEMGKPDEIRFIGRTKVSQQDFHLFLEKLQESEFSNVNYGLIEKNCNKFSNRVSQFLTGQEIPDDVKFCGEEIRSNLLLKLFLVVVVVLVLILYYVFLIRPITRKTTAATIGNEIRMKNWQGFK